jgi:hypothetical protein
MPVVTYIKTHMGRKPSATVVGEMVHGGEMGEVVKVVNITRNNPETGMPNEAYQKLEMECGCVLRRSRAIS